MNFWFCLVLYLLCLCSCSHGCCHCHHLHCCVCGSLCLCLCPIVSLSGWVCPLHDHDHRVLYSAALVCALCRHCRRRVRVFVLCVCQCLVCLLQFAHRL